MSLVIGMALTIVIVTCLIATVISQLLKKDIDIDSPFALRMLPAGPMFIFEWKLVMDEETKYVQQVPANQRHLTLADARLAFKSYMLIRAKQYSYLSLDTYYSVLRDYDPYTLGKIAQRKSFISLHDFIAHVTRFDTDLKDTLGAREVDPSEHEPDRSGWTDEDNNN